MLALQLLQYFANHLAMALQLVGMLVPPRRTTTVRRNLRAGPTARRNTRFP